MNYEGNQFDRQLQDQLQEALEKSRRGNEIISALLQSSRAVLNIQQFDQAAVSIYEACKRLIGATAGYVALLSEDSENNEIVLLDTGGETCSVDPTLPMPIRGLREKVYQTSKTVYENEFSTSPWTELLPTGHANLENVLFAPLVVKGITVGLLGLANKPGGFTEDDSRLASAFGELAAISLFNTRIIDTLQVSEERFRSVAQTASDAIITIDSQGIIVFWNNAATAIFGYAPDEVAGKSLCFLMPERFRSNHHKGLERVVNSGETHLIGKRVEMTGLRKDGSEFPIELSLSTWKLKGESFFSGIIRDVTERDQAQAEIRSLAKFPSENRNPVLRILLDGTIQYANQASVSLLVFWDCQVGQKLPAEWQQRITEVCNSRESCTLEVHDDQHILSLDLVPVLGAGYINLYGRDITEQRRAQELLKDQNQFITHVFESLNHPFFVIDAKDYTVKMGNTAAITGGLTENSTCFNLIHGRNTPCDDSGFLCPLAEIKKNGQPVVTEHVHLDGAGNEQVHEVHAHPILNEHGQITQIIEYTFDITERKLIEMALRESEDRWRSLAEGSPDNIVTLDPDLSIQFANFASPGLTVEELLGVPIYTFVEQERQAEIKGFLEGVLATGKPGDYETEYVAPDGSTIVYESRVVPRMLADEVIGLTLVARDITERIKMEAALQERSEALGKRVKELNCLYSISALVERPGITLPEILQRAIEIIPSAWQYPQVTGVRLTLGNQDYCSENYANSCAWKQTAEIRVNELAAGYVEVCYLEEKPPADEGPFLKEERDLIDNIARYLGRVTERIEAECALQEAHHQLEQRVQERTAALQEALLAVENESAQRQKAYESEQYAHKIAETLRTASQALTRSLDLNTVLNTLLDYLSSLVPYDSVLVLLLEDELRLNVRAARGYESRMESGQLHGASVVAHEVPQVQELLTSQQSLLIMDTNEHPGWKALPGQEHVSNWLGVPLAAEGKIIGLCGIDKTSPGFFTQEHRRLAETLIVQATVAIQNAWLFEQVRSGRERLQSLSRRLVEVQESERRYIARELHDEAGQALTSLKVGLRLLEREVEKPEELTAGIVELGEIIDGVQENLHRLAMNLRPASLDHLGLVVGLSQYIEAVSDQHGLMAEFEAVDVTGRFPVDSETAVYRIVQEAVTNVIRHAQATRVDVLVEQRDHKLIVLVEDNGIGFDPLEVNSKDYLGLIGMRERAEMLGGGLQVECSPGVGTTIRVEVPHVFTDTDRG